jgi:hypothetical protein
MLKFNSLLFQHYFNLYNGQSKWINKFVYDYQCVGYLVFHLPVLFF